MSLISGGIPVMAFGEDQAGEIYFTIESASGHSLLRLERE
jgi:hypothetical protein